MVASLLVCVRLVMCNVSIPFAATIPMPQRVRERYLQNRARRQVSAEIKHGRMRSQGVDFPTSLGFSAEHNMIKASKALHLQLTHP